MRTLIDAQTALNEEAPRIIYGRNNAAQELKAHEHAMKTSALPPLHPLLSPPPPRSRARSARVRLRTETHIYTSPPGAAPGAAHFWARPEVGMTWGFITQIVSPGRGFIVHPQVGPSPPRVRATP